MPVYMDRHYVEGATRHALADAHQKDLALQEKYDVKFLTYWFDETRCTAFCLIEAPNRETIERAHNEAHGLIPNEVLEVDPAVVEAFLGRIKDPPSASAEKTDGVAIDAGFRAIMFTDLKDSTRMTMLYGDAKALHLVHVHNALIRNCLNTCRGREIKHTGDGLMASFSSVPDAVECAVAVQKAFAAYNQKHRKPRCTCAWASAPASPSKNMAIYSANPSNWRRGFARTLSLAGFSSTRWCWISRQVKICRSQTWER